MIFEKLISENTKIFHNSSFFLQLGAFFTKSQVRNLNKNVIMSLNSLNWVFGLKKN
jgi:hypothetical protein